MSESSRYYLPQESERLRFRPLTEDEIPLWSAFFIDNDRMRFVGASRFVHLSPLEKASNWINRQMDHYAGNNFGQLAVIEKASGKFIGVAGLIVRELQEDKKEYEVTYSLLPESWNKGYATEVATHFKHYAFKNLECDSVISIIHVENEASENVAVKNGMIKTVYMEFMEMPVNVFRVRKIQDRRFNQKSS